MHYSPNRGNCRKMSMLETAELLFSLNAHLSSHFGLNCVKKLKLILLAN